MGPHSDPYINRISEVIRIARNITSHAVTIMLQKIKLQKCRKFVYNFTKGGTLDVRGYQHYHAGAS